MSKLEPCPFCASDNLDVLSPSGFSYAVHCNCCGCHMNAVSTYDEAVQLWNARQTVDKALNER
jgi:hypothetical protein